MPLRALSGDIREESTLSPHQTQKAVLQSESEEDVIADTPLRALSGEMSEESTSHGMGIDLAADITAYVQGLNLSEENKALLVSFLNYRPHYAGLRSKVAAAFSSGPQKPNLKAFDDVLCNCLMVQTTLKEIEEFRNSIQLFGVRFAHKTFSKKAKACLVEHAFSLESLTALMNTRSSTIQSLSASDAWENAIKRYGWMLAREIDTLSPRQKHHMYRQADCGLLHWILKANHIPAATHDTTGDGNCFLYSIFGAIHDAVRTDPPPREISNEPFAKALRWLIIVHAKEFCGNAVTEELANLHYTHTDPNDSSAADNSHCEPHAFMPRMCILFQMNMRVLRASRKKSGDGKEEWHLETYQYSFLLKRWNEWVQTTSLAGKIPFLEWDPVTDADAINAFQEMGGPYAFIHFSIVTFDGKTLSLELVGHDHNPEEVDLCNVVPMLLGQSDSKAETTDQLIIAMVSCDVIGHYCCLRGDNVQSLDDTRRAEVVILLDKLTQTWSEWNVEAEQTAAKVKKAEKHNQKMIAKSKKEDMKKIATKKDSKQPHEEEMQLSQPNSLLFYEIEPHEEEMQLSQRNSLLFYEIEAMHALSVMAIDEVSIDEKEKAKAQQTKNGNAHVPAIASSLSAEDPHAADVPAIASTFSADNVRSGIIQFTFI